MRKKLCTLFLFCLILGLFAACGSPDRQLDNFTRQLSRMESYVFTAVGELTFEDGIITDNRPLRYIMVGTHSTETEQFSATLSYTDAVGQQLYELSLFEADGTSYIRFVPLFQYLMDTKYADIGANSMVEVFGGNPFLLNPPFDFANLPLDLLTLIDSLDSDVIRDGLTSEHGSYTLRVTGDSFVGTELYALVRPFSLLSEIAQLIQMTDRAPESPLALLVHNHSPYTELELVLAEDDDTLTAALSFTAPDILTLTIDLTFREIDAAPIDPPQDTIEVSDMRAIFNEYRAAQARRAFLENSGLEIVTDLPELHMVGHQLGGALLEPFEMEIGGERFDVSVMSNAVNTSGYGMVHSVSSAMTLMYTALDAYAASETLAQFILIDLDVEDLDAENFQRTDMRINAHNTAAVNALFYDDNHMGRTLRIYVLQAIADTDQALFLGITVFLENMTHQGRQVLDRLGFYIGIDLSAYLTIAAVADDN
ncbi:MAG: hypothetical protein FWD84_04405 [Oscillospiraceae bacterium]|nr:hypothetical protein [Oscillospiraceae bacterium]